MKKLVLLAAAVLAYFALTSLGKASEQEADGRQSLPVDDLAHKLQDAWADHHTVA